MSRDFSLRAWEPLTGNLIYDVLVSKGKVYTRDLNFYSEEKDLELQRCTGLLDIHGKVIWEKDLVAAIIKDPAIDTNLKEGVSFYWVAGVTIDGSFTKMFQVRYSISRMAYYLFPFGASESIITDKQCFYINDSKQWNAALRKIGSPNSLIVNAKEKLKSIEHTLKVEGCFR